ncbi:hypothetical protein VTO42DRAFT_6950 [Malbranchea cinnamomea]
MGSLHAVWDGSRKLLQFHFTRNYLDRRGRVDSLSFHAPPLGRTLFFVIIFPAGLTWAVLKVMRFMKQMPLRHYEGVLRDPLQRPGL